MSVFSSFLIRWVCFASQARHLEINEEGASPSGSPGHGSPAGELYTSGMRSGLAASSPIKGSSSPRIDLDAEKRGSLSARKSVFANISSSLLRPTKAFLVGVAPAGSTGCTYLNGLWSPNLQSQG